MSRGVRVFGLAAAAGATVFCLAAGYDVLAWPAYGAAMFLLASLVYDNGPVGEREDSDTAPAAVPPGGDLQRAVYMLAGDEPTIGLPAVGRAHVDPGPPRHLAGPYVYGRYRPSSMFDTREIDPTEYADLDDTIAGHPDLDRIDWSAPLLTARGPLCWECADTDPAPWCDCRDGERCKGPCRQRAHAVGRCPGVPR